MSDKVRCMTMTHLTGVDCFKWFVALNVSSVCRKLKETFALTPTNTTSWISYKVIVCLETTRGLGTQRNLDEINSGQQRSLHRLQ